MLPHGLASFPGIAQVLSFSYTNVHGITPGIAQLEVVPQGFPPAQRGNLQFTDGFATFVLRDCVIDQITVSQGQGGFVWRVDILDRRWQWSFGKLSGEYNLRYGDNELIADTGGTPADLITETEKSPQDLARLCLSAMGESRFDVSDLPNDSRPEIHWDLENPAEALASLCDALGCRVVFENLSDSVAIRRNGVGQNLPVGSALLPEAGINPPELPTAVAIVSGPVLFQFDFALEAVGLDTDDTVKPIDDLSYAPDGGWEVSNPEVLEDISDPEKFPRAAESVFRWYRILPPGNVLESIDIQSISQVLPLVNQQVVYDQATLKQPLPPWVFGIYQNERFDYSQASEKSPRVTEQQMVRQPFTLDEELGIVQFDNPVYKLIGTQLSDGTFDVSQDTFVGPADLILRCACNYKEQDTRAVRRHEKSRQIGRFGGPTMYLPRLELRPWVLAQYDESTYRPTGSASNLSSVETEMEKMLDSALLNFTTQMPIAIQYANFLPIQPDGAIQHVTWSFDASGIKTYAAAHREINSLTMSYGSRRRAEILRRRARRDQALADRRSRRPQRSL